MAAEVVWIQSLLRELGLSHHSIPVLCCDNLGATYLCANPVFYAQTKYVEIDCHFVRECVAASELNANFLSTKD